MTAVSADTGRTSQAAAAIRHHYDVGNAFYSLWLDRSLTYSCAMPAGDDDTLEAAQERKIRFHLDAIGAGQATSVLDIGCGWGAVLARLAETHRVARAVGLTLSDEQAAYVRDRGYPGVEVRTDNWLDYEPAAPFDGIISIGAFEHFATPADPPAEKVRLYREFFRRCHGWLNQGGVLSLQTIAYANMSRDDASAFMQREIFPNADLPTLAEITAAAEGVFEVRSVSNGRLDYAWTCERWARRLRSRRDEAAGLVGPETVARYERYLKLSALGFRMGKICLLRIVLRPYDQRYFAGSGDRRYFAGPGE
ncbi:MULTISPECIES: cyclopropane-fatty-acyl-phospholipid synthase family protein [unclassified Pseudofrankia]|uniref:SAM-dependent methyltransferase n=1 Tax=unclassified Pseudofrankia TaxID=2994372 RepID=UPI0008DA5196|nr:MULTISPECIES: cyclopropane-fatty-acyl-phospholipid synthase family protein [unclassified Pseudofrankia]MDT3439530.1 cyclopropane-fatty-acyl-phospholipid synthase family protein [Pseudofrankia sp. BMG5.37]OHV48714.1 cyclopropane-fatty-acyl-phospholipid synthase [Pseudofrankia sp. BMG5.36]